MTVLINGQFMSEEQAAVPVTDRSFLFGDGVFETIPVYNSKPFRWAQHLERLARGADFLKIRLAFAPKELRVLASELIERNQMPNAVLRLTLSRGPGDRGYSPTGAAPVAIENVVLQTAGQRPVVVIQDEQQTAARARARRGRSRGSRRRADDEYQR